MTLNDYQEQLKKINEKVSGLQQENKQRKIKEVKY